MARKAVLKVERAGARGAAAALALTLGLASALGGCAGSGRAADVGDSAELVESPRRPAAWEVVGRSVEGRVIEAKVIGSGARRVVILGGIHGDEPEGRRHIEALAADLEAAIAARRLRDITLTIVRDVNPDGSARRTRTNVRGVDLNRNWPAGNFAASRENGEMPLSEPETRAAHLAIASAGPEVVIVLHSSRTGPFVNYDGPAGALAEAFAAAARTVDGRWRVQPSMGYPTPGSLGSWFGVDGNRPILTIEFRRGDESEAVWESLRAGVEAVLWAQTEGRSAG